MTAEDIKAYCLSKHKACEAYPFGKVPVCYKLNDKIFAQLYPDEGNYKITLKCTADAAQFYRMVYPDKIVEGYHCSKTIFFIFSATSVIYAGLNSSGSVRGRNPHVTPQAVTPALAAVCMSTPESPT